MKSQLVRIVLVLSIAINAAFAQVSMPTSRIVFQRGNDNYANVPIAGRCGTSQTIQARAIALNGGNSTDWQTVAQNVSGTFEGNLRLSGGWYRLEVRTASGHSWSVDRVGVGEVFVTAGQSNSYGNNWDTGAATDDRVSVADYWGGGGGSIAENELPMIFSQAGLKPNAPGGTVSAGPAAPLYMWGAFGDKIVQKTGVPVLILGAGYGGTSSSNWRDAANGAQSTGNVTNNAPYRGLGVAILHYLKRTGVRAILWHQGESDGNVTSRQDYINNVMVAINKSRQQSGFSSLSWVIAKASYIPTKFTGIAATTDPGILSAQEALGAMSNNWSGPYTDPYQYPQHRLDDQIHFARADCQFLAGQWADRLDGNFFAQVQPSLPSRSPLLTTGYVLPMTVGAGAYVNVPYISTLPVGSDNQYRVDILSESGTFLATLATGNGNPISVTVPAWANGRYRVRVSAISPAYQGEPGEVFTVNGSGFGVPDGSTPVVTPPTTGTPPSTGTFSLLAPTYDCSTKQFTFNSTASAGTVKYWAAGIVGATTNAGPYPVNPAPDANAFSLSAQLVSGGAVVTYSWDWKATCIGTTPVATTPPVVTPPTMVNPPVTGTFSLLAPTYNCSTKQFTFNSTGTAGTVQYWAAGIVGRTTNAGPYPVNPAPDANAFSLSAQLVSGGAVVNYSWDWKAACNGSTPITPPVVVPPVVTPPIATGTFALLAPTYDCTTKAFTFNSTASAGTVQYWAVGITGRTTTAGIYNVNPAPDAGKFTLNAQLVTGGDAITYSWDGKAACGFARVAHSNAETAVSWLVYPNPTPNTVRIESTLDGAEQVSLYSITGQSLLTRTAVRFPLQLDLAHLPPGHYIIRVLNQNQRWNHRLVRQ